MPVLPRHLRLLFTGLFVAFASNVTVQAHQVPTMQIEAEFLINQNYTLRINLDPRLFLSDQPASLPPVAASWYLDQTPEQVKETEKAAMAYLRKNVKLQFGVDEVPMPDCKIVVLDGDKNQPITAKTQEVHLQATAQSKVPAIGRNFMINLSREAGVSLILLNTMEGQSERKPRIVFPGEGSAPFPLTGMMQAETVSLRTALIEGTKSQTHLWMLRGGIALTLFIIYSLFMKKRRLPKLVTRKHDR